MPWKTFPTAPEQGRKSRRISLLIKILAKIKKHPALSSAYKYLLNQPTTSTVQTRSQARNNPGQWSLTVLGIPKDNQGPEDWTQPDCNPNIDWIDD